MPEIDNLSIQISASETQAVDGLEKLAKTLERLKNAVNGAAPTKGEANRLRDFGQALNALRGAENIRLSSTIATQIGRIGTAIGRITSSDIQRIQELGSALRGLNGAGNGSNVDLRVAGNNGQQAAQAVNNGAAPVAPIVAPIENMGGEIQPVVDDITDASKAANNANSVFNNLAGTLDKGVGLALNNTLKGLRWIARESTSFAKSIGGKLVGNVKNAITSFGQFFNSIKRIAMYRAIRTALKLITQGFSEGIKNLYTWSSAANGTFAASMDRLATSSLYLKNSLGAMVSPLINALAPAIDLIIDKFVDMLNVINQVIARLTGQTTYTAAKKYASQWQDASDSVSGSAKEIKRTILGFDEINKLNGDNGSGGGAGGTGISSSDMFETREISSWIQDMVAGGDFSLLGQKMAEKINSSLSAINWESIKASAVGITDSITSMINGFINDIDPIVIGKTFAEVINTAVTTIDRFWSRVKWAEAGTKLHDAILKFFNDIEVEKAADALTGKFSSLVTLIKNALPQSQEEWNTIGTKISTFINKAIRRISSSDIGEVIGNLIVGSLTTMTILAKEGTLTNIANGIKNTIEDACAKITPAQVQEWVNSVLKDVLNAVSVLMSIDLKFGDVHINPIMLVGFIALASSLIKSSFGKIFGSTSISGIGKGIALAASVALFVDVGVRISKVIDDIKNGNKVSASDVTNIVKKAFIAAGLMAISFGKIFPGALVIGLAFTISPIAQGITELVNNTSGNVKVTKDALIKIAEGAFKTAGVGLAYAGIKTGNLGLVGAGAFVFSLGFAVRPLVNEVEDIKNQIETNGITWGTIERILGDSLIALGAALLFINPAAGAIVLGIGVSLRLKVVDTFLEGVGEGAKNIWDWITGKKSWGEIFDSGSEEYTIGLKDPDSYFGNTNNNGNGVSRQSGVSRQQALTMDVGVNFTSSDNHSYKNSTLGNYLVDTMAKVKSEAQTKVSSVAGALMKLKNGALVPVTEDTKSKNVVYAMAGSGMADRNSSGLAPVTLDTTTTNTVNGAAGSFMTRTMNKFMAIVGNTDTINTVKSVAGAVSTYRGGAIAPIVSDTATTNTVKAAPGVGMVQTWDGIMPVTKDTTTTNTVKAAPGARMVQTWDGIMPIVSDTSTSNVVRSLAGNAMMSVGASLTPIVNDTTTTANVNAKTPWGTASGGIGSVLSNMANSVLRVLGLSGLSTDVDVGLNPDWGWWGPLSALGLTNLDTDVDVGLRKDWWGSAVSFLGLSNLYATVSVGLRKASNTAIQFVANSSGGVITFRKSGGIFANGIWSDIPSYANGTTNAHGSLFMAGEAGPEIVGHVGGRTEVLNKSQLAAAMYQAVNSAMQGVTLDANFYGGSESAEENYDAMYQAMYDAFSAVMAGSAERDREKVQLLRQINDKEFTAEVTTRQINKSQTYANRRAGTTVVAVGT